MLRKIISSFPFIFNYYSGICTIFNLHRVKHIDLKKIIGKWKYKSYSWIFRKIHYWFEIKWVRIHFSW